MTVKRYAIYCERRPGDMLQENEHGALVYWGDYDALAAELAECRARLAEAEREATCKPHMLDLYAALGTEWGGNPFPYIEALRRDAERYRWIRSADPTDVEGIAWNPSGGPESFDELVDASMDGATAETVPEVPHD
jgi:hypothetical protein